MIQFVDSKKSSARINLKYKIEIEVRKYVCGCIGAKFLRQKE